MRKVIRFLIDKLELIALAFVLTFIIQNYLFMACNVPTESMVPTVLADDKLVLNRITSIFREPKRGEIISFIREKKHPVNEYWLKRVIGLPGDNIDLRDGNVYINGLLLEEEYTLGNSYPDEEVTFPYHVPDDMYFVMGDNREGSYDSRGIGPISTDQIIALGGLRVFPFGRFGELK